MLTLPRLLLPLLLLTPFATARDKPPAAKTVSGPTGEASVASVVAAWGEQTGYRFDLSGIDATRRVPPVGEKPFWEALEALAKRSGTRVALRESGKVVALRPATKAETVSSIDGPFRAVAREVRCKRDLESGRSGCEVAFDLHWEPRFEVFRVGEPRVGAAREDTGKALTSPHYRVTKPVTGYLVPMRADLEGVTRAARTIDIEGTVTATLAEELLTFTLDDLTKPGRAEKGGVGVAYRGSKRDGKNLSCTVELLYPSGGAEFESFETYWLRANEFALIDPSGKRLPVPEFESTGGVLTYHLRESPMSGKLPDDLKGWKAEVRTPGAIRDVEVRFALRGIELP